MKKIIPSGPSPVWTFKEDVCAYIYDDKAYKKSRVLAQIMSLLAHFPIVSYQPWNPLGESINKYTAHWGKLNRSVLAFMRGSRGGRGSGLPGESRTMLRTKNEELLSDSRAWTPWQHFLDPHIALHLILITTVQYRVCDIPVKGLWALSGRCGRWPVTWVITLHTWNVILWLIFIKGFSCC